MRRRRHQRRNPPASYHKVPEGFTIDPLPWVDGTVLEDFVLDGDAGFFHVTANAQQVRFSGELFSRREMKVSTLGGGGRDEAANMVSFHINRNRAEWMAGLLRMIADHRLPFRKKVRTFLDFCEYPLHAAWGIPEDLSVDEDAEPLREFLAPMANATGVGDIDVLLNPSELAAQLADPPSEEEAYEMLVAIDQALIDLSMQNGGDDVCRPYLGLTAPWRQFQRIRPENIAIVQAAIRLSAGSDMNATECELRFLPRDIVLVSADAERDPMPVERGDDDE